MTIDLRFYTRLLRSCTDCRSLSRIRSLHLLLLKSGFISSLFVSNSLIQMYTRCAGNGDISEVRKLFDEMPHRNCFSYNSLVDAYLRSNDVDSALQLFDAMPEKNAYSWNAIVMGLVRLGDVNNARKLFDEMRIRDAVACNAMIHGYIRSGRRREAFQLYRRLDLDPTGLCSPCNDRFVLATVVSACANYGLVDVGKQIHGRIVVSQVEVDSVLGSALVNMYGKCEDLDSAHRLLNSMKEPDEFSLSALISGYAGLGRLSDAEKVFHSRKNPGVVLWNSMINGYVSNDQDWDALHLFLRMRKDGIRSDPSTFASVMNASASSCELDNGRQLHGLASKLGFLDDIVVASALLDCYSKFGNWGDACRVFTEIKVHDTILLNSMINVYSNCGRIEDARQVFEMIPSKSLISWNSMIVGYSQNGCAVEALELFCKMHQLDVRPDNVALASAISASASICSLVLGGQIFALSTLFGLDSDQIISTSLVDLYCKCGNITDAERLFDSMMKFDEAPWNSMLMGYAINGFGIEVLKLFDAMRNAGVPPNEVTFIGVLSGCCHCGLVEEGLSWFRAMRKDYGVEPVLEHYACMVYLFVRAGRLEEAIDFIDKMPFRADSNMWTSVLGGCKAQGNELLASKVAEKLIELNPQQSGPYVQLSSIYAIHGEWQRSTQVRRIMLDRRISKSPGYSWIDH